MTYVCVNSSTHKGRNAEQTHDIFLSRFYPTFVYETKTGRCEIQRKDQHISGDGCVVIGNRNI